MPPTQSVQDQEQRGIVTELAGQAVSGAAAGVASVAAAAAAKALGGNKKK